MLDWVGLEGGGDKSTSRHQTTLLDWAVGKHVGVRVPFRHHLSRRKFCYGSRTDCKHRANNLLSTVVNPGILPWTPEAKEEFFGHDAESILRVLPSYG